MDLVLMTNESSPTNHSTQSPTKFSAAKVSDVDPFSPLFTKHPLVIWTNDYHIATIQDIRHLLEPIGVKFFDKSLTPRCKLFNSCADNLTVITFKNGIHLNHSLIPQFYEAYKDDWQMKQVDAFVCYHPTSMCEAFMPFNRSIITVASTRYEHGRMEPERWTIWNSNLQALSKHPKNIIAGNNKYDAKYIQYFTGIEAEVLPSYCGYPNVTYNPIKPGFLLFAGRTPQDLHYRFFYDEYERVCSEQKCPDSIKLHHYRELYLYFKYENLTHHHGLVYVPYQVSLMSLFEQYRMNVPMFFPSLQLLTRWHMQYYVVKEKSWMGIRQPRFRPRGSPLPAHPSQAHVPDPNNETDPVSVHYWLSLSDFYHFPHITYFESVADLVHKLKTVNLAKISQRMVEYNARAKAKIVAKWRGVLQRVARYSTHNPS